ncbi:sugar transferase [Brevundimonas sp. Root1423]|uniref:sugar transferase n=1 Tax=Brevundimonas sp. Root1423 TaxID=1736462 RepID=UPI0006FD4DA1|nr:sugar transferase [Brevundimonas sp. Root1423]KQY84843.1 sugar transferase [Brevundimonas sp. Root1423]
MIKRTIDVLAVLLTAPLTVPLAAIIALLVRSKLGSPVIFSQDRPGKGGKPFRLLKFRTMTCACGPDGQLLPDADRLTPFGARFRSSSLDEIPALWNVLKGDMSLVGPRPLLMEYLPLYSAEQARRHLVRPGVTGLAQVSGRNSISWDEKFALDTWYVDHRTLWLDVKILLMTVSRVISREGVSAEGQATMSRFTGSPPA